MTRCKTHIKSTPRDTSMPIGPKGVKLKPNIEYGKKLETTLAMGTKTVRINEKIQLVYFILHSPHCSSRTYKIYKKN